MNEILNSLQPMVQKLSETFCVSVDVIQNNLPDFLIKFGRYSLVNDCVIALLIGIGISIVVFLISVFCFSGLSEEDMFDDYEKAVKKFIKILLILLIVIILICVLIPVIKYSVSPEIYGAMNLLKALN